MDQGCSRSTTIRDDINSTPAMVRGSSSFSMALWDDAPKKALISWCLGLVLVLARQDHVHGLLIVSVYAVAAMDFTGKLFLTLQVS